jgi:hypothetical protein
LLFGAAGAAATGAAAGAGAGAWGWVPGAEAPDKNASKGSPDGAAGAGAIAGVAIDLAAGAAPPSSFCASAMYCCVLVCNGLPGTASRRVACSLSISPAKSACPNAFCGVTGPGGAFGRAAAGAAAAPPLRNCSRSSITGFPSRIISSGSCISQEILFYCQPMETIHYIFSIFLFSFAIKRVFKYSFLMSGGNFFIFSKSMPASGYE